MRYIEMSLDEAMKKCKKSARILVAEQDLNEKNVDIVFFKEKVRIVNLYLMILKLLLQCLMI